MVDLNFQKYPAYKSSGVEWLGDIPEHWEVRRLKYLVSEKLKYGANEEANSEDKSQPRYIRITDFDENGKLRDKTFKSLEINLAKDYLLSEGDILFARSGATVGKTFQFKDYSGLACFAGYLIKAVPKKSIILSDYLYLFTKSKSYDSWKSSIFIQATIQNIGADKYSCLFVPLPPISEQQAIANFLDQKLAQIDKYIAKKQRMIELLKEQKTVIINRAVTKGLNPDVPMKFSGIEWLGEIPEHWEVKRLGWIASEINDINHEMPKAVINGVPFLSAKDLLDNGTLNFTKDIKFISEEDFERLSKKVRPQKDDIIYSRIGARLGKSRLVKVNTKFLVSYSCCIVRVKKNISTPEFINIILDSEFVLTEAKMRTVGVGVPDLGLREISRFPIPFPPLNEQKEIALFIEKKSEKIERSLATIEKEIKLIQEYRTSLISETVTGKIDVRKYPPPNQKSKTFSE